MADVRRCGVLRQVQALFDVGTMGSLTDGELLRQFGARRGEAAELAFAALVERLAEVVAASISTP
jgi:RNA polymerase sigma-70 factor (ECF subfamily)